MLIVEMISSLLFSLFLFLPSGPAQVERHLWAMGTPLDLVVEAQDRHISLMASEQALRAVETVENRLSTWKPESELSRLNRHPAGEPFPLSPSLAANLAMAQKCWKETGGAFDPGIGALAKAFEMAIDRVPTDSQDVPVGFLAASTEFVVETVRRFRQHSGCRRIGSFKLFSSLFVDPVADVLSGHSVPPFARKGHVWIGHLDVPRLIGDDTAVVVYGLSDKGEVVDLFTDRVEAEFAMLDVAADEPDLDLEVVELEARTVRVVARHGSPPGCS